MKKTASVGCLMFCLFAWICSAAAEMEHRTVKSIELPTPPVDVAVSPNEKWYYILTPGNVLVYSVEKEKVVHAVPVGKWASKLTHAPESNLLLVADSKENKVQVIQIDAIYDFSTENSPYIGPAYAPVEIVIFNHYQCPYCSRLDPKIEELMELFENGIKVVYKAFPPYNDVSRKASAAAVAAHRQGKFWEMHHAMHEIERPLELEKIMKAAEGVGLDMEKFKADLDAPETMALVQNDIEEGLAAEVDAVPCFFINGIHLENKNLNEIYQRIGEAMQKASAGKTDADKAESEKAPSASE